jgi:hypothetical protein
MQLRRASNGGLHNMAGGRATMTKRRRKPLERWDKLSAFLSYIVYTGWVSNGRPQSAFLISDPGHGKTELLERFRGNETIEFHSDATNMTLISSLRKVLKGQITHVAFTEFQKILARRKAVSDATVALLLQAMEEGVHDVGWGPRTYQLHGARLGVIAATTTTSIGKNPFLIQELAMDSRAFFIDGAATDDELMEIEQRIVEGDDTALRPMRLHMPDRPVNVTLNPREAERVRGWVREMERKEGVNIYGLRTLTRFLHTLKGVALFHGETKVVSAHVDELYSYKDLWLEPPRLPDNSSQAKMRHKRIAESIKPKGNGAKSVAKK